MDSNSLVEAEKLHVCIEDINIHLLHLYADSLFSWPCLVQLVQSFEHLSKALDQVSASSTQYATLLAGLSSKEIIQSGIGPAKLFIPPSGNALTGLLFRTPFSDAQAQAQAANASRAAAPPAAAGKKRKNRVPEPVVQPQSKKKRRVSEIAIPLPVVQELSSSSADSDSEIEGSRDGQGEAIEPSRSISRTPYKPLMIGSLPKAAHPPVQEESSSEDESSESEEAENPPQPVKRVSSKAAATSSTSKAVGQTSADQPDDAALQKAASMSYEELQAQIAARAQKARAEKLAYNVNSEGSARKASSASAAKGKGKMVTIPASALERSLSPANNTATTAPLIDKSDDPIRRRIEESLRKAASASGRKDAKKVGASLDMPLFDTPYITESQLKDGGGPARDHVANLRESTLMKMGVAASPPTKQASDDLASLKRDKVKKAGKPNGKTEISRGVAGGSVAIGEPAKAPSYQFDTVVAEAEAAIDAIVTDKKQKKKKKEKQIEQLEAVGERAAVNGKKEKRREKKTKKAGSGQGSLLEKAIMQSVR